MFRFEGGELARINSTEEVARKDQQQQHRVMVPVSVLVVYREEWIVEINLDLCY